MSCDKASFAAESPTMMGEAMDGNGMALSREAFLDSLNTHGQMDNSRLELLTMSS